MSTKNVFENSMHSSSMQPLSAHLLSTHPLSAQSIPTHSKHIDQSGNHIELENLAGLHGPKVIANAKLLAKEDRLLSRAFLIYVEEVDRRRLFADAGFDSTMTWLIKDCGLSEGAAQRRYQAALLLRAVPDVGAKIESGDLNMRALVQTASVIRKEEERTGERFKPEQKAEILKSLEQTSYREAEFKLKTMFTETPMIRQEHVRVIDSDHVRATVTLSKETLEALERLAELMSHKIGKSKNKYADVIQIATEELLKRIDPLKKEIKPRAKSKAETKTKTKKSMAPGDLSATRVEPERVATQSSINAGGESSRHEVAMHNDISADEAVFLMNLKT